MKRKRLEMKCRVLVGIALLLALLSACSKGDEALMNGNYADAMNTGIPSQECFFRGVWSVNDVSADTIDAYVQTKRTGYGADSYVAFVGFPLLAITRQLVPDVQVATITDELDFGVALTGDKASYAATLQELDFIACMQNHKGIGLRSLGISGSNNFMDADPQASEPRYLPFVVTDTGGAACVIILHIKPGSHSAILDNDGKSFLYGFTAHQAEFRANGKTTVRTLGPEMKIKYTSIRPIQRAEFGN